VLLRVAGWAVVVEKKLAAAAESFPRDGAVRAGGRSAAAIVPFHLIVVAVSELAVPKAQRGRSGLGLAR
jgi:hypothetical protein